MKKRNIIFIIVGITILIIGVIGYIAFNNRIISTITLDINPSIKINLNKKEKVVSIIPINKDAKNIIKRNLKGKSLDNVLDKIVNNITNEEYIDNDYVAIILYTKGNIKKEKVESTIQNSFNKNHIAVDIITIENITKEDVLLAKKYNISPAKASYIKSITEDNTNIIEEISSKSVNEIRDTKETGKYCSKEYTLEGDWCIKEIKRISPTDGKVCPKEYYEYNGKCYEETEIEETNNLVCRDEFNLENNECIRRISVPAVPVSYTCSVGEVRTKAEVGDAPYNSGPANDPVCIDPSSITHPVNVCELPASDPTERMSYGGKCYWHRAPVIAEGCPGKIQVNGSCWDDATNIYLCPNSNNSNTKTKDDYCYVILNNIKPTPNSYKCDDDMTLNGDNCIKEEKEDAMHERFCKEGYTLLENDRCINFNETVDKENGLVCEGEDTKLKGNTCIVYEKIEAMHN